MGDSKSKFPDFQEILGMGKKLYNDVKKSFCEIISSYKKAHEAEAPKAEEETPKAKTDAEPKTTKKSAPKAEKESKKSEE